MSRRSTFTTITPLPPGISRQAVVNFLQNHREMIDLNPLVKERHPIRPPSHAAPDEMRCAWYSLTDHISYLPGKMATGEVTYTCAFNNLPNGVQTHCYAPGGLDIRNRWTVNGSLPGEPLQPLEIGLKGAPTMGLYIREDVDMMCNVLMSSFVKKTLKDSHGTLVQRLKLKAQTTSAHVSPPVSHRANDSIRSISSVETVSSSNNLSVYSHPSSRHSNSSTASSVSSSTSHLLSPHNKPRIMSPPTPPYTPMTSPLWSQLQPPKQINTLASLTPQQSPEMGSLPQLSLIPEPLRVPPRPPHQTKTKVIPPPPNSSKSQQPPQRNFSYDSTSSTENYLVTSTSPPKKRHNPDYYEFEKPIASRTPQPPPHQPRHIISPQQQIPRIQSHNRYEEHHPDYPHMNPYEDDDDDDDIYDYYGGGEGKNQQQPKGKVLSDRDSGYAEYVLPPIDAGATLAGPFIAAFDEFNICIP